MITLQDLFLHLEQVLSPGEFSDYCPNGIQVEGKKEVQRAAFAVSASVAAIEASVAKGADVLIVHHGIFWNKDPYPVKGAKKKKLQLLLANDMTLLAYHLPLDAHQSLGNNWRAARDLGLTDLQPFYWMEKTPIAVKGRFPKVEVEVFQKRLEAYYGHAAHTALGGKKEISSAAIFSGGAHRQIELAAEEGVDCFITGSFDEPIWDIAHEQNIHFFALGHYATERVGILSLMKEVQQRFGISCEFIDLPNPF
ncbi:MAG: Nif3-like dinuclear metal center hexameric protein [Chlamydiota bacterium]